MDKITSDSSTTLKRAGQIEDAMEADPPVSRGWAIATAFIVALAFLMQGVDSTLLVVAIPTIARDLNTSPLALHFAITTYTFSLAVFMPVSGWFADRFGARTVFIGSLFVFTLGSILCGLSDGLLGMVAARALQGFGGAVMTPVGRLIVLRAFGRDGVLDAMLYLTLPLLIGPIMGPLLGGLMLSYVSWHWIFFVNVPVCLIGVALTFAFIRHDRPAQAGDFDFRGFFIAGAGLILFQLGIEGLGHPFAGHVGTALFFVASAAVAWLYWRHARRHSNAALDLTLFSSNSFSVGVIGGGIGRVGLNSSAFLLPLMLQIGFGLSPLQAGFYAFLSGLGVFGSKGLIRVALVRLGFRRFLIAVALFGVALLAAFAFIKPGISLYILIPAVVLIGASRTMYYNTVNTLTYYEVPHKQLSRAVSSAGVFQQLSMGMGISLASAVLAIASSGEKLTQSHFSIAFAAMAMLPLFSIPFLFRLGGLEYKSKPKKA
jgi:EmrB/QacA subfamily drug resistance transporter